MNREMRRAQTKADKKQEQDKQRAKAQRIIKREEKAQRRRERIQRNKVKPAEQQTPRDPKKLPGRWSGIFTLFVTIFIVMQSVFPTSSEQNPTFGLVVNVLYYFMFAYFLQLWLSRRQTKQALYLTCAVGVALTLGLISAQFFIPDVAPNIRLAYFGIPAVIAGAFAGQLVFTRA